MRKFLVGRRRVRFPASLIEAGNRMVGSQPRPNLMDIRQVLAPGVAQHRRKGSRALPTRDSSQLFLGVAFAAIRFDHLLHSRLDRLVGCFNPALLMAVELRRFLPVAASFGEPAERDAAQTRHVGPRLHKQRQPAPQLGQIFRQRMLRIPILVVKHRGVGRHRPHPLPRQRHQGALFARRPQELFERRPLRRVAVTRQGRIERRVAIGQERLKPRTARQTAVESCDRRTAVGLGVIVNIRIEFKIAHRLPLANP